MVCTDGTDPLAEDNCDAVCADLLQKFPGNKLKWSDITCDEVASTTYEVESDTPQGLLGRDAAMYTLHPVALLSLMPERTILQESTCSKGAWVASKGFWTGDEQQR